MSSKLSGFTFKQEIKQISITKNIYFLKICYHTSFQDPSLRGGDVIHRTSYDRHMGISNNKLECTNLSGSTGLKLIIPKLD
jgi:hypothetical protein